MTVKHEVMWIELTWLWSGGCLWCFERKLTELLGFEQV